MMRIGVERREKLGHVVRSEGPVQAHFLVAKDRYLETIGLHEIGIIGNFDWRQVEDPKDTVEDFIHEGFSVLAKMTAGCSKKL
jgi:hypothetical protein